MDALQHVRSRSPSPPHKKPRLDSPKHIEATGGAETEDALLDRPTDAMVLQAESSKKQGKKRGARKPKNKLPEPYSNEDVVHRDVVALLGEDVVNSIMAEGKDWTSPFQMREEVQLTVSALSSNGESLSIAPEPHPPWVILTPFALPGEVIRARVYRHSQLHSYADLIEVVQPNTEMRDDSRVQCKYFGKCAGCQYQMLSYETQLDLKRNVIVKAYNNFSSLPSSSVPEILPTIGSPLQYGYRTKLTPHFDRPAKKFKQHGSANGSKPDWFNVGFNQIGTRTVMDIEECPIATPVLNKALGPIRENIFNNLSTYKKGVSLLLRESIEISPKEAPTDAKPDESSDNLVCVTNHRETVRERVGDMLFEYTAGSFFQNNNSVLVPLTSYVRDAVFACDPPLDPRPTHLVDAYCGSGLFAITLSPHFEKVAGIELSSESIACATKNAKLNNLPEGKCSFLEGDAANIFSTVQDFPRDKTVLIIDPPRKGSDEKFIDQLIKFGCQTVVYVSCNVHTQARDVGMILQKSEAAMEGRKYVLDTVRGFDLFPQTAHVESVAVLRLVESSPVS
ncbi:S-adenosyl-L-methionine-dependent methyltransferase [Trametopsis cervina]|nr:S-adenosyl-L-methionine-dependent methyltransferase [Trametopsis cervina]